MHAYDTAFDDSQPPCADRAEIERTLDLLLAPDQTAELRILGPDGASSGIYPRQYRAALIDTAARPNIPGARYLLLNPIRPGRGGMGLLGVQHKTAKAVSDRDIESRRWLPIDFDPLPHDGSTDAMVAAAITRALDVRTFLRHEFGFPDPIIACSGNGAHLLYKIDLAPEDDRVKRILALLSDRFTDDVVVVDPPVHNAARIFRLYGTVNGKGTHSVATPHRVDSLLRVHETIEVIPTGILDAFLAKGEPTHQGNATPHGHQDSPPGPGNRDERPGARMDREATIESFAALLESHGWARGTMRGGELKMFRPGKHTSENDSGGIKLNKDGIPVLYIFTPNGGPLPAGVAIGPFRAYALLEHGGDLSRAAKALGLSIAGRNCTMG